MAPTAAGATRGSVHADLAVPALGAAASRAYPLGMTAYVVVDIHIHDSLRYEEYKRLAAPSVSAFGGRYLARGGAVTTLEGDWTPGRFVLLEFPSAERAREWWSSDLYRPIKAIRHATARSKMILIEGC
jgi:uncharacterized protein (DUF1330 family)